MTRNVVWPPRFLPSRPAGCQTVLEPCGAAVTIDLTGRDAPSAHVDERPWGRFELLTLNTHTSVKILTVEPGRRLSLQRHTGRDEWWTVLDRGLYVEIDGERWSPEPGERVWVPRGTVHRVGNDGDCDARLLEVAFGDFDEDDIERLEDDFARAARLA